MIELGNKVKDTITGFTGIAIGKTYWLHGCTRIGVQPTTLHDGKVIEADWFDEQRLVVLEASAPVVSADSDAVTGGPQRDPRY